METKLAIGMTVMLQSYPNDQGHVASGQNERQDSLQMTSQSPP